MKKAQKNNVFSNYTFHTEGIWLSLIVLFFLSLLVAFSGIFNAASLKLLVDIGSGESKIPILAGALFAFLAVISKEIWNLLKDFVKVKTQNKIADTAKKTLLRHMERVPYLKLSEYHSGDLLTRLSDDTDICAGVLPNIGSSLFVGVLSCVVSLVYGFYLNWKLMVLCILLSPLAVLWSKLILPFLQRYVALTREKESEIRSFTQEEISYIPVIKSFLSYRRSEEQFHQKFLELSHARVMTTVANSVLYGGSTVVGFFSFIGAASLGAYLALNGEITVGTIVGFLQLLNYIIWPFTELMPLIGELQKGKVARARIREIEQIPKEEGEKETELHTEKIMLMVHDVSFSYGADMILQDINLDLEGKQFVGVIGPSGCGKSTFMQLLMALYQPSSGTISLVDGNCNIEGTSIRKYISYVPQDHLLISGTIAENIAYGQEQFEISDVLLAAKRAGIHEFICTLPKQYETQVQEKGANFSFGQAQRIAIARAIFKDAPVLILDEPTASLDNESKKIIIDTLQKESKNKLCIMVCHDQTENSLIFDRVLKFENGKIINEKIQ